MIDTLISFACVSVMIILSCLVFYIIQLVVERFISSTLPILAALWVAIFNPDDIKE